MHSSLVKELEVDIIEVRRNGSSFNLPQGDFVLQKNDILKVRCDVSKIQKLKNQINIQIEPSFKIGDQHLKEKNSSFVELVITSNSEFEGKTLKELDFRRRYRAVPLAIRHREDVVHDHLYQVKLKAGDVVLAEIKNHFISEIQKSENDQDVPFILISENSLVDFDKRKFYLSVFVIAAIVLLATFEILDIMVGSMLGVIVLVLLKNLSMKEAYESINWQVIFLLAGALSLGVALKNS
jgi:di/tricarboxylate transporter